MTRAEPHPRKLRVLVVGQGAPTTGGIPSFLARIVADPWLRERAEVAYLNTHPRGVKRPGALHPSNLFLVVKHARQVRRRARGSDVVHLNLAATPTLPLLRALALAAAARLGGSAVVLHAHTGQVEECVRRPVFRWLLRLVPRVTDRFVVVSETARLAVERLGLPAVQLDNAVDPGAFETGPKEMDPPLLAFTGTVCERKGLIDLRDALLRLRDEEGGPLPVRVVIVGDGAQEGPGAFERVRDAFARSGLHEVEFLGARPEADVRAVLARAAIFCLPSHWEGFPLSLLEAMAAETAVIATTVGAIPRMLDEGRAGVLVAPHDPLALAAAIRRLSEVADERGRLAHAARARVEREYAWERMVRSLYEVYRGAATARATTTRTR